jgi:hypothetical protein
MIKKAGCRELKANNPPETITAYPGLESLKELAKVQTGWPLFLEGGR